MLKDDRLKMLILAQQSKLSSAYSMPYVFFFFFNLVLKLLLSSPYLVPYVFFNLVLKSILSSAYPVPYIYIF